LLDCAPTCESFQVARPLPFIVHSYRARARSVFLFGFAKNERDNVEDDELATLRDIAKAWFAADDKALQRAVADGLLQEVDYDQE
jgi:hypothetical protein